MSVTSGRERPVKSNEKLMNVEHRITYPVYFKKTERAFVAETAMQAKSDFHKSSLFNLQYSIFNSAPYGLMYRLMRFSNKPKPRWKIVVITKYMIAVAMKIS